jgi:hypothetical protein
VHTIWTTALIIIERPPLKLDIFPSPSSPMDFVEEAFFQQFVLVNFLSRIPLLSTTVVDEAVQGGFLASGLDEFECSVERGLLPGADHLEDLLG